MQQEKRDLVQNEAHWRRQREGKRRRDRPEPTVAQCLRLGGEAGPAIPDHGAHAGIRRSTRKPLMLADDGPGAMPSKMIGGTWTSKICWPHGDYVSSSVPSAAGQHF